MIKNSRREKMGKKYLETKNNSLESSVIGVWKTAAGEGESIRDAAQMTKAESKLDTGKLPSMKDALMQIRSGKSDGLDEAKVNPKDREELDTAPSDTAKKIKRALEPAPNQMVEASGDKEAYKKFFDAALKKFKASSPADLKGDQKKKFFDYIDANWEGDNEKAEGAMSQVREYKIQSMKAALAKVWGLEEGKVIFDDHDDEDEDFIALTKKLGLKFKTKGDETTVSGSDANIAKMLKTMKMKKDTDGHAMLEKLEDSPNPANKQHLCAKNVVHEEWGSGNCVPTQHANPDEEGNIAWYDVMFEHGIEKEVSADNLKIIEESMHSHSSSYDPKKKMKMKKEVTKTATGKKAAVIDVNPKIKD